MPMSTIDIGIGEKDRDRIAAGLKKLLRTHIEQTKASYLEVLERAGFAPEAKVS